jgi:epoxyqueuosine reductase
MKSAISQRARELGFDDCRFTTAAPPASGRQLETWLAAGQHGEMTWLARNAEKRLRPQLVLPGARSVIVLAVNYFDASAAAATSLHPGPAPRGFVARYARHADYHDVLGKRLKALTESVNQLGGADTRSLWYVDTGPILERDFAQRAGLGFIGKHTNLISRRHGNWLLLAEILTTLELAPDPPERNHCGTCTRCLVACPTGAITAPFQLDARRCVSYLTIELKGSLPLPLRPAIGNRIFGCDDCLAACPWNRFARAAGLLRAFAQPALATPDLLELLALDNAGFKTRFHGTPLLRTKRRGLLRNVCVALGNIGDRRALPGLSVATTDTEPLIQEHAAWAVGRIENITRA